jgi:hypothetical protein
MWLRDDAFLTMLDSLEINTANKAELFDVLDSDQSGELEVGEIIAGLMTMRGPPQKSDMVAARLGIRHTVAVVEKIREKLGIEIDTTPREVEYHEGALNTQQMPVFKHDNI